MAENLTKISGWIDIHAHFTPPTTEDQRLQQWQAIRSAKIMAAKLYEWKEEDVLSYMDWQGIATQMFPGIPLQCEPLRISNDYDAPLVKQQPLRFGLLAALPTNNLEAAMAEVVRAIKPLWELLNNRPEKTVVFVHPNAYAGPVLGRPSPLVEVAFDTTRIVVDMLYKVILRRHPNITFILAHCGGALPALSGRSLRVGNEEWVLNPENREREEMKEQLGGSPTLLLPALEMTRKRGQHRVYGSDCGVPCSNERLIAENLKGLVAFEGLTGEEKDAIGGRGWELFPRAAERMRHSFE